MAMGLGLTWRSRRVTTTATEGDNMDTAAAPATRSASKTGLVALISGALIIVGAVGAELTDPLWVVLMLGIALLLYALPAVHRHQAPADGAVGEWGSRLVLFGGGVIVLLAIIYLVWEAVGTPPEEDAGAIEILWPIGFFSFLIGIVLFAIGSIRAKVLPAGAPWLMLLGLIGGVAIDMATGQFFEDDPEGTAWGFVIGVPLFGLGVAWIGYVLRGGRPATTSPTTPT